MTFKELMDVREKASLAAYIKTLSPSEVFVYDMTGHLPFPKFVPKPDLYLEESK